MRLWHGGVGGAPAEFDPPDEDADLLQQAARSAEYLAQDHHAQASSTRNGTAQAAVAWSGPRAETFMRAAADAQLRTRSLADSCAAMAHVLSRYAQVVRHAAEAIAALRSDYLRQLRVAAEERELAERAERAGDALLAPYGMNTYGVDATVTSTEARDANERAHAAERRAEALVEEAADEHRQLQRRVRELVGEIADLNDRAFPGSSRLSPQETARRVQQGSALGHSQGVEGVLAALRVLDGAGAGIPVTAINKDASVNWAALKERHPVPRTGTDPVTVSAWWGGLADWQHDVLLREDPTLLGNLDGLPARIRDQANRASIGTYRARLQAEVDEFDEMVAAASRDPRPVSIPDGSHVAQLRDKLRALDRIEEVLAKPGQRQLLVLDPFSGHQLHAAVAVGDVDKADHVAVFIPGFKTNVQDKLTGYDEDMKALWQLSRKASRRLGDHGSVATVTWIGYDAPQTGEVFHPGRSVADASLARKGGDALASFFTGINASRGDRPPHLTALGHSYGSLTTAYALKHKNTGVDDAIVFGSPGMNISDVGQLELPAHHLMEAEAADDRIADLGSFGTDPSHLFGIGELRTDAADTPLGHTRTAHGHGGYLKNDTTSQYNIAVVVAGLDNRYQLRVPTILDPGAPPDAMFGPSTGPLR